MPLTTVSVAYATYSDVAQELDLSVTIANGSIFTLWGKALTTATLTRYANHGNDRVYALVGDVSSSTLYKNNLAVRLATKYASLELITHYAIYLPDVAFNFSLGGQRIDRGTAAVAGIGMLKENLEKEITNLEFQIAATADGVKHDETDRDIYTDHDTMPYIP